MAQFVTLKDSVGTKLYFLLETLKYVLFERPKGFAAHESYGNLHNMVNNLHTYFCLANFSNLSGWYVLPECSF